MLQNYGTATIGRHTVRFGGRARAYRDADYSTGGANGSYYFADKADCFALAYAAIAETFATRIFAAAGAAPDWRGGVRAGLGEALALLSQYRAAAQGN